MNEDSQGWTIGTLKAHMDRRLDDMDRRYEQRFASQERALQKAETATESRFTSVNEFRAQMGDQQRTLMPRAESESLHKAKREHLDALSARLDRLEGQGAGKGMVWGSIVAVVGILIAIITLVLRFIPPAVPAK